MAIHYVSPSPSAGLQDAVDDDINPGDTIVLEAGGVYLPLKLDGVHDLHLTTDVSYNDWHDAVLTGPFKGIWDALYINDCSGLKIDRITAKDARNSIRIIDSKDCLISVIAISNQWPVTPDRFNVHGIDNSGSDRITFVDCAAIGNFRKAFNSIGCLDTIVRGMYIRHHGYFHGGTTRISAGGQGFAPNYHSWNGSFSDVLVELDGLFDDTYYVDGFSSDGQDDTNQDAIDTFARLPVESPVRNWYDIRFNYNRCMVIGRGSSVQSNYGCRFTQGDTTKQAIGVMFKDFTSDLDAGWIENVALNGDSLREKNVMDTLSRAGPEQSVDIDANWTITYGEAVRPRLSDELKLRVTYATQETNWPTKFWG